MSLFEIIILAFALAADAFAVSVSCGAVSKKFCFKYALKSSVIFGVFQGVMPLLGVFAAGKLINMVAGFSHWIAFAILFLLGFKMIWDGFKSSEAIEPVLPGNTKLFVLAVATSIDALAAGISLALVGAEILASVIIIAGVTATVCFCGFIMGTKIAHLLQNKADIAGGLILIGIGTKILITALV